MPTFETIGFIKEFYIGHKYIGSIKLNESDRGISYGYDGRKNEIFKEDIFIPKGTKKEMRKIKAGTELMTIVYPMNGKWNRD
ncbi:MAG TPA: hypothetical protein VIJ57_08295 [Hanamia sp.]